MSISDSAVAFAGALLLAFLTESMVEYIFGAVIEHAPALKPYAWCLMYVALAAGVGLAFYYELDLIAIILGETKPVGHLLTGLAIGRGANYVHDLYKTYIAKGE